MQILNKAAIIFCAAIWEAFVEELVEEAVKHLATHVTNKDNLTPYLRQQIETQCQKLINNDAGRLWDVASKSIGDLIRDNAKRVANTVPSTGKEFNTAKTKQVSALIHGCLGLSTVEVNWTWQGLDCDRAKAKLDKYIEIRGDLAHGKRSISSVPKTTASQMLTHFSLLAAKTDEAIQAHLLAITGVNLP